jgi:hypothetical protein
MSIEYVSLYSAVLDHHFDDGRVLQGSIHEDLELRILHHLDYPL